MTRIRNLFFTDTSRWRETPTECRKPTHLSEVVRDIGSVMRSQTHILPLSYRGAKPAVRSAIPEDGEPVTAFTVNKLDLAV